jgi:UDP-2,4-diacetamido-2,4,6-trideoxy-beta-L-altropyranose hydrolase
MRCLTLADELSREGWACGFACSAETPEIIPVLSESQHEILRLESDAQGEPKELAHRWPDGCNLLAVDHYQRDGSFESACRPWAQGILAIDDLANRSHDCDFLLDQTFGRQDAEYRPLVPSDCQLLLGSQFALLRPQFAAQRKQSLARRLGNSGLDRIFVSLGAGDPENVTRTVLEGIARSGIKAAVDVVLGSESSHLESLRNLADSMPQHIQFHVGVRDMAELMARADVAIGAGGTTSWERCSLGLPTLVIVTADNQAFVAEVLRRSGAALVVGRGGATRPEDIAIGLRELAGDDGFRTGISRQAAQICDGRGALRVRCALLPESFANDGMAVSLRLATAADTDTMFRWQSDERTRRFARTATPPDREEHESWVRAALDDIDRVLCIVLHDKQPAGVLRFDHLPKADGFEVSILVDPEKYGRGIAAAALTLGRNLFVCTRLVAEVLPGNEASHKLFRRAGYRQVDASHYLNEPGLLP